MARGRKKKRKRRRRTKGTLVYPSHQDSGPRNMWVIKELTQKFKQRRVAPAVDEPTDAAGSGYSEEMPVSPLPPTPPASTPSPQMSIQSRRSRGSSAAAARSTRGRSTGPQDGGMNMDAAFADTGTGAASPSAALHARAAALEESIQHHANYEQQQHTAYARTEGMALPNGTHAALVNAAASQRKKMWADQYADHLRVKQQKKAALVARRAAPYDGPSSTARHKSHDKTHSQQPWRRRLTRS